jgi:lipid II isoglutaminyl synthase (glutamine-hydrolysing)
MDEAATRRLLRAAWESGRDDLMPEVLAATSSVFRERRSGLARPVPYTARALARAAGAVARARGGAGTTLPGKVLLRHQPDAIARLSARVDGGVVLVAGTNGKTTTAGLIAAAARRAGHRVVHNRAGANVHWGIATALVEQRGDIAVLEVDEAWLPLIAAEVEPRVVVLCNLFRDRLDGYGERDAVAEAWRAMRARVPRGTAYVVNADDPTLAQLAGDATRFGIEDHSVGRSQREHAAEPGGCAACGGALSFDRYYLSHLGHYKCEHCGARRPTPAVAAYAVRPHGLGGVSARIATPAGAFEVELPTPGIYSVYNALAATAASLTLGIEPDAVAGALAGAPPPFGRAETVRVGPAEVTILLMKNPAGANELVRLLAAERSPRIWIALNDATADGRDVSWIWDVDFEALAPHVQRVMCSGTRAAELAARLKYAGWVSASIEIDEDVGRSMATAAARPGRLVALPTYSAMLELRILLGRRGLAPNYWET